MDPLPEYAEADTSVSLDSYERTFDKRPNGDTENYLWPLFHVLKATLQFPVRPWPKSQRLAQDLVFFCEAEDSGAYFGSLRDIWGVFLGIARCVPPSSPWQESMVDALDTLTSRGGSISYGTYCHLDWSSFYSTTMEELLVQIWQGHDPWKDWTTPEEKAEKWKNLVSFVARMTKEMDCQWRPFAAMDIEAALENPCPDTTGLEMDTKIWTATEWILVYGNKLYEYLAAEDEPGPLVFPRGENIQEECHARWALWRERLTDAAEKPETLQLSAASVGRAKAALKAMDVAEKHYARKASSNRGSSSDRESNGSALHGSESHGSESHGSESHGSELHDNESNDREDSDDERSCDGRPYDEYHDRAPASGSDEGSMTGSSTNKDEGPLPDGEAPPNKIKRKLHKVRSMFCRE